MYDPQPDEKDQFIQTFEGLIGRKHKFDNNDESLREEIRQRIEQEQTIPTHVSQDN